MIPSPPIPAPPPHLRIGKEGEEIARAFLERKGYRILERNVRFGKDEIDIVAFDPGDKVTVFAEVKARRISDAEYPAQINANKRKLTAMRRAAYKWMVREGDVDGYFRLDVVCVEGGRVTAHYVEVGT